MYSGHVQSTTVARISPSGYYAASADIHGNGACLVFCMDATMVLISVYPSLCFSARVVRIWDTVGADQVLKAEYKVLGGKMCVALLA